VLKFLKKSEIGESSIATTTLVSLTVSYYLLNFAAFRVHSTPASPPIKDRTILYVACVISKHRSERGHEEERSDTERRRSIALGYNSPAIRHERFLCSRQFRHDLCDNTSWPLCRPASHTWRASCITEFQTGHVDQCPTAAVDCHVTHDRCSNSLVKL